MFTTDILTDLYRHMEWADAAVWKAVLAAENGQSDAKTREYFYHLHMVQRLFLRTWRNEDLKTPFATFDEARELMSWGRSYYDEIFEYLGTLIDEKLSEPKLLPWASMIEKHFGPPAATTTLGETFMQVALHSTYHRGQINARLREIGGEPPLVDYIAWLLLGRPAAAWPEALPPDSTI